MEARHGEHGVERGVGTNFRMARDFPHVGEHERPLRKILRGDIYEHSGRIGSYVSEIRKVGVELLEQPSRSAADIENVRIGIPAFQPFAKTVDLLPTHAIARSRESLAEGVVVSFSRWQVRHLRAS